MRTDELGPDVPRRLGGFDAVWCVPASPYADTAAALAAIGFARAAGVPFLGTCGGFQHALLDYARSHWQLADAAHAELDPRARDPVIAPLSCGLVEVTDTIVFTAGTRLAAIYGLPRAVEGYHCRYGLSAAYAARLDAGPLKVAARDGGGEVRAVELEGHPFFVATLFQPERSALAGRTHPLISAFATAAAAAARSPHPRSASPAEREQGRVRTS